MRNACKNNKLIEGCKNIYKNNNNNALAETNNRKGFQQMHFQCTFFHVAL